MSRSPTPLLLDANVLIDFAQSDPTIIKLLSRAIAPVKVATLVYDEVRDLTGTEAMELGIELVEPTLEDLKKAGQRRSGLSFADHLCLTLASENGWICVTNDKALRRECSADGVRCLWGLEAILQVVRAGALPVDGARAIGTTIHKRNPHHIHEHILQRFFDHLDDLSSPSVS